tara:strand:+ start:657 stop:854 length:198 start_codon:yes stop_codon:yes gene_type:complete
MYDSTSKDILFKGWRIGEKIGPRQYFTTIFFRKIKKDISFFLFPDNFPSYFDNCYSREKATTLIN